MQVLALLALVGSTQAAMYTWAGPALNFDSAGAWAGGSSPVSNPGPASVTFGSRAGPIVSSISSSANVGNSLNFVGQATLVMQPGASINFGNPGPMPATFLPASQTGFSVPSSDAVLGGTAAAYQWNCPLNWRVGGQVPLMPPSTADQVTIGGGGFFVSTFNQQVQAGSLNGMNSASSPAMCNGNSQQALSIPGTPGSTLSWGAGGTCPNMFAAMGQPAASCGNLIMSTLTGKLPNTVVQVWTCPDNNPCGPLAPMAILVDNTTGTAMAGTVTPTSVNANGAVTAPTATDGSVAFNPSVGAFVVDDPNGASDSSSSGLSMLVIVVIVIAVIVIVAVLAVVYVNKNKTPPPQQSGARGFGGVGFENPLYDENPQKSAGGGPQYADAPQGDSDYMDMPATDGDQETGYMDVPAEGEGGGYLDVDGDEGDEDNF